MDHFSHEHPLILNEDYIARKGDLCYACREEIVSCKSFVFSCNRDIVKGSPSTNSSDIVKGSDESLRLSLRKILEKDVNNCNKFLLHKTCAELPRRIESPRNPKEFLVLHTNPPREAIFKRLGKLCHCNMCKKQMPWIYCTSNFQFCVCLECAMSEVDSLRSRKFKHPSHSQHPLALIQRPSSFKCDACKVEDNTKDMSYKCIDCPFWMHKSCADAPTSFLFQFHKKHPLILSFSLPEVYQKFEQHCRLCGGILGPLIWLYYCPRCRFFTHFQCARRRLSNPMFSYYVENEIYPDLVHLPAANESSRDLFVEQFIKEISTVRNNAEFSTGSRIKDWAHGEHLLQLITIDELNDQKDCDDILLICDGCTKPIRNDGGLFYACVRCKYFLHKFCGELPRIKEFLPFLPRAIPNNFLDAYEYSEPYKLFKCIGCGHPGNGISFHHNILLTTSITLHIGCSTLPRTIKHESHRHPLQFKNNSGVCKACGKLSILTHGCGGPCNFRICTGCIMMARTVKHRWDPHPLHLIYDPEMVTDDHEHGFHCEFCSDELDTNLWFYHCDECDLSFHLSCYEDSCYLNFSHIKFGATNIIIDELHPHSLTFVLNKKVRHCGKCRRKNLRMPVLECPPCETIFCMSCCGNSESVCDNLIVPSRFPLRMLNV